MIDISKLNRISSIFEKIASKHKLVKDISFDNDIEVDKSDRFIIDSRNGSLNFLHKKVSDIKPEDCSLVLGQMLIKNGVVEIISTLNNMTDNKVKRAHIITNQSFSLNEANSIKLDLELPKDNNFFIMINNKYSYDLYQKQKYGKIFLGEDDYNSPMRKVIVYQFTTNLTAREYEGAIEKRVFSIPLDYKDSNKEMVLNMKKGFLFYGGYKIKTLPVNFAEDEELYISLVLNSRKLTEQNPGMVISAMELNKDNGFVYFKPIRLEASKVRIFMLYAGTPAVQMYSQVKCSWLDISNDEQISNENHVSLRIAMKSSDKIYKIFITEKNQV